VRARPAQDGGRFGILDVERARRLSVGEDVADGVQDERVGGPVSCFKQVSTPLFGGLGSGD
jgi:hypothetical protein